MSNLSQDLQKLQQEALIAEQKAEHKNAEVQAAQKKLDTLHEQIDRKTKRLLVEQATTIADAKKSLSAGIEEQNAVLTDIVQTIADFNATKRQLEDDLSSGRNALVELTHDIATSNQVLGKTIETYKGLNTDIDTLKAQKTILEQELSALTAQIPPLTEEIATLQARIVELKQVDATANEAYAAEIAKKQEEVRLLDAQLLTIRLEAESVQQEEAIVRDSLATWQKALEERDQNIRVRELKVEQGEGKIIRNSSLLNL